MECIFFPLSSNKIKINKIKKNLILFKQKSENPRKISPPASFKILNSEILEKSECSKTFVHFGIWEAEVTYEIPSSLLKK